MEPEQLSGPHFLFAAARWPRSHPPGGRHRPRRGGGGSCLLCGNNAQGLGSHHEGYSQRGPQSIAKSCSVPSTVRHRNGSLQKHPAGLKPPAVWLGLQLSSSYVLRVVGTVAVSLPCILVAFFSGWASQVFSLCFFSFCFCWRPMLRLSSSPQLLPLALRPHLYSILEPLA